MKTAPPIPPREQVACMDQIIDYAERNGYVRVSIPVFELKEWRDTIDRIAGEVA